MLYTAGAWTLARGAAVALKAAVGARLEDEFNAEEAVTEA